MVESGTISLSDFNVNEYLTSNYSSDSLQFNYFQFIDDEDEDDFDEDEDEDYTNFDQYVGERILLHCNWGWWGSCNGYYEAKIFDLKKGAIEYDNYIIKENNHDKYENLKLSRRFRMIEYQNPNE